MDNSFCRFTGAFDEKTGILRNTYNRKLYYRETLNLILPVEVQLHNGDGVDSGCRYSYVPTLDTIAMMLMDDKIRRYCEKDILKDNGRIMFDILDGRIGKDNEFIKNNENVVQILAFQDAFEICNPIGAWSVQDKV